MTLPVFLLIVYGKQRKREEGGDKILQKEILKDIGIQRFVACLAFTFHSGKLRLTYQLFDVIMHACMYRIIFRTLLHPVGKAGA